MKIATQVGISVVALGVIGGGAYFAATVAIRRLVLVIPRISKIGNSPIMASGGSMTFRSAAGWTCDTQAGTPHTKCITSKAVAISTIEWDNVLPPDTYPGELGWTGLSTAWTLDLLAKANSYAGGVHICTSTSGDLTKGCDGPGTSYSANASQAFILIATVGKTSAGNPSGSNTSTLSLVDSAAYDSSDLDYAVQYYDPDCTVHNPSKIPACEHPQTIQTSLDMPNGSYKLYKCQHGDCQIAIDK
jgi:hypothetical protein